MIQDYESAVRDTPVKLTYHVLWELPEDHKRHELIDGVHYVTPSPVLNHQRVVGNLHFLVRRHLEAYSTGEVWLSPVTVVLTLFDAVIPDLLYVSNERANRIESRFMRGAPDLLVEVLSPSTARRDEGIKLGLYSRHDVLEYWVIDPVKRRIRVYRRRGRKLVKIRELPSKRITSLTTPLIPGMSLPLDEIFGF